MTFILVPVCLVQRAIRAHIPVNSGDRRSDSEFWIQTIFGRGPRHCGRVGCAACGGRGLPGASIVERIAKTVASVAFLAEGIEHCTVSERRVYSQWSVAHPIGAKTSK